MPYGNICSARRNQMGGIMADKPETDPEEFPGKRGKSGFSRPKHAPAIDLPPSDVSEIKAESADSPSTEAPADPPAFEPSPVNASPADPPFSPPLPPSPAAPATPKLVPALIGLVAGAIGGFGAYYLTELSSPVTAPDPTLRTRLGALEQRIASVRPAETVGVPQAFIDRLAKAETGLSDAQGREAALRAEISKLSQDVAREAGERRKALETLARPTASPAPAVPPAEIEGLKARIASVEDATKGTVALGSKVDTLQPRLETVSKNVEALTTRISGLTQREALGAANARMAAVALVEDGFATGRPLGKPLKVLKDLGTADALLAPLMPFAEAPPPDAKALLAELRAIRPPAASPAAGEPPSIFERVKQGALSLVEVRRTGEITGTDDAAHLARAGQALGRGDIATALTLTGRLSSTAAPAYAAWRSRAEARIRAGETMGALRADALAVLAAAVQPAK